MKDEAKGSNEVNTDNEGAKVDSVCFNSINNVLHPAGELEWGGGGGVTGCQMSKVLFSRCTRPQATPTSHITEQGKVLEEIHK